MQVDICPVPVYMQDLTSSCYEQHPQKVEENLPLEQLAVEHVHAGKTFRHNNVQFLGAPTLGLWNYKSTGLK